MSIRNKSMLPAFLVLFAVLPVVAVFLVSVIKESSLIKAERNN